MSLFKRKKNETLSESPTELKGQAAAEVQTKALQVRARRRLVGAIVLILAAVIVLPLILDSESPVVSDHIPIKTLPVGVPLPVDEDSNDLSNDVSQDQPEQASLPDAKASSSESASSAAAILNPETSHEATRSEPANPDDSFSTHSPRSQTTQHGTESQTLATETYQNKASTLVRSDDGAQALALLEGRALPSASSTQHDHSKAKRKNAPIYGHYVLQIAAYTTQVDANERRIKLHAAGITNVFVEQTSSGEKAQYRLRVGPFPSREAAQAAQARLRTLGYDNGFIATQ